MGYKLVFFSGKCSCLSNRSRDARFSLNKFVHEERQFPLFSQRFSTSEKFFSYRSLSFLFSSCSVCSELFSLSRAACSWTLTHWRKTQVFENNMVRCCLEMEANLPQCLALSSNRILFLRCALIFSTLMARIDSDVILAQPKMPCSIAPPPPTKSSRKCVWRAEQLWLNKTFGMCPCPDSKTWASGRTSFLSFVLKAQMKIQRERRTTMGWAETELRLGFALPFFRAKTKGKNTETLYYLCWVHLNPQGLEFCLQLLGLSLQTHFRLQNNIKLFAILNLPSRKQKLVSTNIFGIRAENNGSQTFFKGSTSCRAVFSCDSRTSQSL